MKYRLGARGRLDVQGRGRGMRDTQRAIRLVRSRAQRIQDRPGANRRDGILGRRAARRARRHALRSREPAPRSDRPRISSRPSFQALIYPGGVGGGCHVPKDAPPAFLCAAFDDSRSCRDGARAVRRNSAMPAIIAELHLFSHRRPRIRHEGPAAAGHRLDRPVPRMDARIGFLAPQSAVAQ